MIDTAEQQLKLAQTLDSDSKIYMIASHGLLSEKHK